MLCTLMRLRSNIIMAMAGILAGIMTVSCQKTGELHEDHSPVTLYPITAGFAADIRTKVTGDVTDGTINDIQVLVFNADGNLDSYVSAAGATATAMVPAGTKTVWAVGNGPDLSGVTDLVAMQNVRALLSSQSAGDLTLCATASSVTVPLSEPLALTATRETARVRLQGITNSLDRTEDRAAGLTIDEVYLSNVPGYSVVGSTTAVPSLWLNRKGYEASNSHNALLRDAVGSTVAYGATLSTEHRFYSSPNPVSADTYSTKWCPRHTRLVVKARIGSETTYYPIALPVLEKGKSYDIPNLAIIGSGVPGPEIEVNYNEVDFTVTLSDWGTQGVDRDLTGTYFIIVGGAVLGEFVIGEDIDATVVSAQPFMIVGNAPLSVWIVGDEYNQTVTTTETGYPFIPADADLTDWGDGDDYNVTVVDPATLSYVYPSNTIVPSEGVNVMERNLNGSGFNNDWE